MKLAKFTETLDKYGLNLNCKILTRHDETIGHCERVAKLVYEYLKTYEYSEDVIRNTYDCAMLHDVGKLFINPDIMYSKEPLTDVELRAVKSHTSIGKCVVSPMFENLDEELRFNIIDAIANHHVLEYYALQKELRLIVMCDHFDAMMSNRCYKKAMGIEYSVSELFKGSGKQYDPEILQKFLKMLNSNLELLNIYEYEEEHVDEGIKSGINRYLQAIGERLKKN